MMSNIKRKRSNYDLFLIAALLLLAGLLYFLFGMQGEAGGRAIVRVDGSQVGSYPLNISGRYPLNGGTNILIIENGEAWLEDASCPDKLCVKQGHIHFTGQSITCLPNRLTVTIDGGEAGADLYVG